MKLSAPQFWRVKENQYKLVITICKNCGRKTVFKRPICPHCGSDGVEYIESAGIGVVEEFTKVYYKRDSSEDRLPEVVGVVKLREGVRVVGEIVGIRSDEVREGMEVEAVLRKYVSDEPYGIIYYGLKFKPV
ncbi:MAG: Zn-ribbon domain-containing OB-fold protein [Sulfolobales archaeon]|nr:Zn-ribbon domain-containing OB-fold protein [Sulfolobales archaeon]MDW8083089.1 Zn-ribbon domain-containing OB-fold protein [Sulfolobales archaeon]